MEGTQRPNVISKLLRARHDFELVEAVDGIIEKGLVDYRLPKPHTDCSVLTFLIESLQTQEALRLIKAGADIKQASHIGYQPIHSAAGVKDITVIKELVRLGASVHEPTKDKLMPIHYALCDQLDEEVTTFVVGKMKKPLWSLKKKAIGPSGENLSGFELFATWGREQSGVLFALECLEGRGALTALREGGAEEKRIFQNMRSLLSRRFGGSSNVVGYLDTFHEAKALEQETPSVQSTRARPRF